MPNTLKSSIDPTHFPCIRARRISGIDEAAWRERERRPAPRAAIHVRVGEARAGLSPNLACVGRFGWKRRRRGGLVREGACVGARGATGSFRHRRPRRTDVQRRERGSRLGGQREEKRDRVARVELRSTQNVLFAGKRELRG